MNVAVIPARGGSKRIPRKNIRDFCGRPMIAWSIDTLRASGVVDRIVVSTDDEEVAAVARSHGAEVPFMRPPELADDHTATVPVISHAVGALQALGWPLEQVCCMYATAPLLDPTDLRNARDRLAEFDVSYVFSCATFGFPILRALRRSPGGGVEPMFPEHAAARSQDLPEAFHDAGQFYWGTPRAFSERQPIFGPRARPYFVPRHRVQDIDTEEDWGRAELLFRTLKGDRP